MANMRIFTSVAAYVLIILSSVGTALFSNPSVLAFSGDSMSTKGDLQGTYTCHSGPKNGKTFKSTMSFSAQDPGQGDIKIVTRNEDLSTGHTEIISIFDNSVTIIGEVGVFPCFGVELDTPNIELKAPISTCSENGQPISFQFRIATASGQSADGTFKGTLTCHRGGDERCKEGSGEPESLVGTQKDDCINGNGGNDNIVGFQGNDKLNGNEGEDLINSGGGNDELAGGPGPDTFSCGAGTDKITDYKPLEGDKRTSDCEQF